MPSRTTQGRETAEPELSRAFAIGLKPLDPASWIEPDDRLAAELAEKERLIAALPDVVFFAETGSAAAQAELRDLLAAHLAATFPGLYRRQGTEMAIAGVDRPVPLADPAVPPLLAAARLVQEDLVLMRRGAGGWRLAAGAVCFPSDWHLPDKAGRPIGEIHRPVPGYAAGTRNDAMIGRIFDNLKVDQPVWRGNWSLVGDDALYHGLAGADGRPAARGAVPRFGADVTAADVFLRRERQTLRRLPASGDIVFTIRITVEPVAALADRPERRALVAELARQLAALDAGQRDYKGIGGSRDRLVAALAALAPA